MHRKFIITLTTKQRKKNQAKNTDKNVVWSWIPQLTVVLYWLSNDKTDAFSTYSVLAELIYTFV